MEQRAPGITSQNRDRVRAVSFYAVIALITYLLYIIARPFIVPLCVAAVLTVFFYPSHARLERRLRPGAAAMVSTLFVTAVLIVPLTLVLIAFVREAAAATGNLQAAIAAGEFERIGRWWTWLQQRAPIVGGVSLEEIAGDLGRRLGAFAADSAGDLLRNIGTVLFDLVIVIFATFFLFRDARPIMALVRRVLPFEEEQRELVIRQAHDLIRASVVSSIAVASAQGTAGGLLFWAVGIAAPVFWGVVMAFFSLLPIGAWAIWLPAGVWLLVNGSTAKGLVLLGVGAGVVSAIDNVLRPALLSGRAQMNGLLVLISLLGGIGAFGLIGVVVGPVIVATMASLLSAYTVPGVSRPAQPSHDVVRMG
jgi:predicted PurR-regulated permease PerM